MKPIYRGAMAMQEHCEKYVDVIVRKQRRTRTKDSSLTLLPHPIKMLLLDSLAAVAFTSKRIEN